MKRVTFLIALSVVLASTFVFNAKATGGNKSNAKVRTAKLTYFDLDPNFQYIGTNNSGVIQFNSAKNEVSLLVTGSNSCPAGAVCVWNPSVYTSLPVVEAKADACGVITYVASQDKRPVDGNFEKLTITDFQYSICEVVANVLEVPVQYMTAIVYETTSAGMDGSMVFTRSFFGAEKLQ